MEKINEITIVWLFPYTYEISMISFYHYFIYKFEPSDHDEMRLMQLNIE
jgi:hypothetical protein